MEEWRDVVGFEGLYQVSNTGRVKGVDRYIGYKKKGKKRIWRGTEKVLTPGRHGYLKVSLYKNGSSKTIQIQRLVAMAFIPNPENKEQVNHIDGNILNNNVDNLEWVTPSENMIHNYYVLKRGTKPVEQYDLNGNYIATYDSAVVAEKATGVWRCSISNVLCGRRHKAGNYIWKYAKKGGADAES